MKQKKVFRKFLAAVLSMAMCMSNTAYASALSDDMAEPASEPVIKDYTVVYEYEDVNGEFIEDHRDVWQTESDSVDISPEAIDCYVTPEGQVLDLSETDTVILRYERQKYSLILSVTDGDNTLLSYHDDEGNIYWEEAEVKINDNAYEEEVSYKWGRTLSLKAEVAEDYDFKEWKLDGETLEGELFSMPKGEAKLTLVLEKKEQEEQETVSENEASDENKDKGPDEAVSDNSVSESTVSENKSVSENEVPEETVSDDTLPEESVSDDVIEPVGGGTVSDDTVSNTISDNNIDPGTAMGTLSGDGITGNSSFAVDNKVLSFNKVIGEDRNEYLIEEHTDYTVTLVKNQKTYLMTPDAWASADKKTATVSAKGKITGKKIGETNIYRYGTMPTTFHVKVVDPSSLPKKVGGYVKGTEITVGKGRSIKVAIPDEWVLEDPKIVKVNKNGQVIAKKSGTTFVYVTGTHNRTYTVKVEDPDILVNNKKVTVSVGSVTDLSDKLLYTSLPITYQINKPAIAEVDVWGNLTAHKVGNAKLYALVNGKKYTFTVKVVNNTSKEGMVNADLVYLYPKKSFQLKVKFPKKASEKSVSFRIEGGSKTEKGNITIFTDKVACVTNKGKITAIADGETFVTVRINGEDRYQVRVVVEGDKVKPSATVSVNVGEYYNKVV